MNFTVVSSPSRPLMHGGQPLPVGARLTMLPPGTSQGAETHPDVYRLGKLTKGTKSQQYGFGQSGVRGLRGAGFMYSINFKNSGARSK